jgi:hypothetical protein
MFMEAVVTQFKAQSKHLPGEVEKKHENSQKSRSPGRDLKPGPPEYKAEALTTRP